MDYVCTQTIDCGQGAIRAVRYNGIFSTFFLDYMVYFLKHCQIISNFKYFFQY